MADVHMDKVCSVWQESFLPNEKLIVGAALALLCLDMKLLVLRRFRGWGGASLQDLESAQIELECVIQSDKDVNDMACKHAMGLRNR